MTSNGETLCLPQNLIKNLTQTLDSKSNKIKDSDQELVINNKTNTLHVAINTQPDSNYSLKVNGDTYTTGTLTCAGITTYNQPLTYQFTSIGTTEAIIKVLNPSEASTRFDKILCIRNFDPTGSTSKAVYLGGSSGLILGAGESAFDMFTSNEITNRETIKLVADTDIEFWTNANTYSEKKLVAKLDNTGNLIVYGNIKYTGELTKI